MDNSESVHQTRRNLRSRRIEFDRQRERSDYTSPPTPGNHIQFCPSDYFEDIGIYLSTSVAEEIQRGDRTTVRRYIGDLSDKDCDAWIKGDYQTLPDDLFSIGRILAKNDPMKSVDADIPDDGSEDDGILFMGDTPMKRRDQYVLILADFITRQDPTAQRKYSFEQMARRFDDFNPFNRFENSFAFEHTLDYEIDSSNGSLSIDIETPSERTVLGHSVQTRGGSTPTAELCENEPLGESAQISFDYFMNELYYQGVVESMLDSATEHAPRFLTSVLEDVDQYKGTNDQPSQIFDQYFGSTESMGQPSQTDEPSHNNQSLSQ